MPNPRRHSLQLPLLTHAEVEFRGMNCGGVLRDVSLSGALFAFDQPPHDATFLRPCRLHLLSGNGAGTPTTTFNGLVVHVAEDMLGIKFIAVSEKERLALLHLFDHHLVEPSLLDRDLPALLKHLVSLKEGTAKNAS